MNPSKLILMMAVTLTASLAHAIPVRDVPNSWVARGVWVEDQGQVLGADYSVLISAMSQSLRDKTTDELMVVTVDHLDGLTVDDYAEQLFKQLGVGQKGKDNGVLILLSRDDRKVRIEVGYGLEAVLNDAKAGRLLDEHGVPYLKDNQFGRGLYEATKAVAMTLATAAHADLQLADPATWPAQPEVQFETPPPAIDAVDKRFAPFIMAMMAMVVLMPIVLLAKFVSYARRQTIQGRKEALTSIVGSSAAPFVLPPLGAVMVGYTEGALLWGIAAALAASAVSVGVWLGLRWGARRVDRWHPQCGACQQAMKFVKTETSGEKVGTATDIWRCSACGAERTYVDTVYRSGRSSSSGWSYSRPSSGGRSSGGGSSGGGGASRSF